MQVNKKILFCHKHKWQKTETSFSLNVCLIDFVHRYFQFLTLLDFSPLKKGKTINTIKIFSKSEKKINKQCINKLAGWLNNLYGQNYFFTKNLDTAKQILSLNRHPNWRYRLHFHDNFSVQSHYILVFLNLMSPLCVNNTVVKINSLCRSCKATILLNKWGVNC